MRERSDSPCDTNEFDVTSGDDASARSVGCCYRGDGALQVIERHGV
jgi:hypothetical protein